MDRISSRSRTCPSSENMSGNSMGASGDCMLCEPYCAERDINELPARPGGAGRLELQPYRRCASLVTASVLFIGKASASSASSATVQAPSMTISSPAVSQLKTTEHRRKPHQRFHRPEAFLGVAEPPRRWARSRRPRASDTHHRNCSDTEIDLRVVDRCRAGRRGGRRVRGEHRMVSAGASGEAISGDFLNPDEPWTIRGQRQRRGSPGIPPWADSPSVSPEKDRKASGSRGTREEALRRAANAVSGAGRDQEGSGSWTPKREGQGSWDKTRSKAAELALPVWLVDLKRGVCTGDITMSQVSGQNLRRMMRVTSSWADQARAFQASTENQLVLITIVGGVKVGVEFRRKPSPCTDEANARKLFRAGNWVGGEHLYLTGGHCTMHPLGVAVMIGLIQHGIGAGSRSTLYHELCGRYDFQCVPFHRGAE